MDKSIAFIEGNMRLTSSFQLIMQMAAQESANGNFSEIEPEHMFMALLRFTELDRKTFQELFQNNVLADIIESDRITTFEVVREIGLETTVTRRSIRKAMGTGKGRRDDGVVHRSQKTKELFNKAIGIAMKNGASTLAPAFLLQAILKHPTPLLQQESGLKLPVESPVNGKQDKVDTPLGLESNPLPVKADSDLGDLVTTLRNLRDKLSEIVLGQEHAIDTFIEGLFSAEVFSFADKQRKRPKGIFIFAGPPGVGKTYLAENGADALKRPFKRFDMSGYSGHEESHSLVGIHKSYKGAHPGILTGFVQENPNSILLFDEIEKAHLNTIHFFLQILDAGRLEDKYTEEAVYFKDTIIIFTTNAGKALYEDSNRTGVQTTNTSWHRKTILDALENEKDQRTGKPFFPSAICSRMATGYPVMFNTLGVYELEQICSEALKRAGRLLESTFSKPVEFDQLTSLCLLLREGVSVDARTITSQAESFVKEELFRFSLLFKKDNLNQIIANTENIRFEVDNLEIKRDVVRQYLLADEPPRILLVADQDISDTWTEQLNDLQWKWTDDVHDVVTILATENIDLVLLDLWVGQSFLTPQLPPGNQTYHQFDYTPGSAKDLAVGQEILKAIHKKQPDVPCFLISFAEKTEGKRLIDDELYLACARSGGARGVVETSFVSTDRDDWQDSASKLENDIRTIAKRVYRERKVLSLGKEHKTLSFETAPDTSNNTIRIRLRNLRVEQALDASDVTSVLQNIERPTVTFDDVYGADAAKSELGYIVKWLRDPRQYSQMGLRPPRGILLHGYPGTGKTFMARALAGESNVAFLPSSATNYVTKWQGSGPENVRELFDRARRYAPSIIFIDEIDAIGKKRGQGIGGAASSAEQTLNSLLVEMDGFTTPATQPVIVIAATNLVEHLDDALRRRFDREIEVDRPDRAAREGYLRKRLSNKENRQVSEKIIQQLAGRSANMTIAELERIIELAGRIAAQGSGVINDQIIEEAFERMRMGESRSATDPETLMRVARHEAGHCLIGWLRGDKPVQITITARGKAGGYVERQIQEDKILYTKTELEGMIRQAMGGRAAEILYYGDIEGLSTGVEADLQSATHFAELMVRKYGMANEVGQVAFDDRRLADGPLAAQINQATRHIIDDQLDQAMTELKKHQNYLDALVNELIEKNRLTLEELETLLPPI